MAGSPSVSNSPSPAPARNSGSPAPARNGGGDTPRAGGAIDTPRTGGAADTLRTPGADAAADPAPAADGSDISPEAAAPAEEGVSPSFLDALGENFGTVDADGDGHLTDAEIAAGAGNRELSPDARAALGALRGRQGAVEEYANDEWFDENSGITSGDLGELQGNPSLDAQRIREEFGANRDLLAGNPDAEFAPLPEPGSRSIGGHVVNAARIVGTPLIPGADFRAIDRARVDAGEEVDPNSRLGAYQATGGFREGTVGYAAHQAIGQIYDMAGTIGEDQIGTVFNSDAARALYDQPVDSPASRQLAEMEHAYWAQQNEQGTFGGWMGSSVPPATRDWLQQEVFR